MKPSSPLYRSNNNRVVIVRQTALPVVLQDSYFPFKFDDVFEII